MLLATSSWFHLRRCDMYAVRNRHKYLATFADRWEAEQWLRDYISIHGHGVWLVRTEN